MKFTITTIKTSVSLILRVLRSGISESSNVENRHTTHWLVLLSCFVVLIVVAFVVGASQFFAIESSVSESVTAESTKAATTLDKDALDKTLLLLQNRASHFEALRNATSTLVDPSS